MVPDTSPHVRRMDAPVVGLVPTSPMMVDVATSVTPVLLTIANVPADPSCTGTGPCAAARLAVVRQRVIAPRMIAPTVWSRFTDSDLMLMMKPLVDPLFALRKNVFLFSRPT